MDNFIVSARKYRPDNFMSVVGQDSITRTLKSAIKSKQLAQAYLFCGPRGVGKTTCARIFAKTINCFNITPDFEACNQCESCKTFNESRSLNIHELDAASNNSVDDIRNLIDQVRIHPRIGKYSIYIIDEVHMLSTPAFNAFLKTLEEPPSHVVFILATTEKHKIIPTILSRCQIFDFNRIGIHDISERLRFVAQSENIEAENDALSIIAQKADGAMRDALSIFDQIVSFSGNRITYQTTIDNLNVLDYDYYFRVSTALLAGNYSESLLIFDEVLVNGFDGSIFIGGLAAHFRNLLMCKDPGTVKLLEVGENIQKKYHEFAQYCDVLFLLKSIELSNEADFKLKTARNKRLTVELVLLKLSHLGKPFSAERQAAQQASEPASGYSKNDAVNKTQPQTTSLPKTDLPEAKPKPEAAGADNKPAESTQAITNNAGNNSAVNEINDSPAKQPTAHTEVAASHIAKPTIDDTKTNTPTPSPVIPSFSIKKMTQNMTSGEAKTSAQVQQSIDQEQFGDDEFDTEKLSLVWLNFSENISDKPRLYQLFHNTVPQINGFPEISLSLQNKNLLDLVESIMPELLFYLKKNLNNNNVKIRLELAQTEEKTDKSLYTDEEKLVYMLEKNPKIDNLIQQLDLNL